ncbi:hypothetical protein WJX75_002946 [Coccomyxa subellipsoidea]|uniref:MORN repeat-containing protein n=1 Tax=Coccomyxa subellipsoidea TaxID=248742 RepID=A0ABR2Z056_9CHLO
MRFLLTEVFVVLAASENLLFHRDIFSKGSEILQKQRTSEHSSRSLESRLCLPFKKLFYTHRLTANGREDPEDSTTWVQQCFEGEQFVGETSQEGLRQGLGRLQYQVGKGIAVYFGQFDNGVKEGFGVLIASSGHRYKGQFHDGVMCGHGATTLPPVISPCKAVL